MTIVIMIVLPIDPKVVPFWNYLIEVKILKNLKTELRWGLWVIKMAITITKQTIQMIMTIIAVIMV